jgi:hypothetical protein
VLPVLYLSPILEGLEVGKFNGLIARPFREANPVSYGTNGIKNGQGTIGDRAEDN